MNYLLTVAAAYVYLSADNTHPDAFPRGNEFSEENAFRKVFNCVRNKLFTCLMRDVLSSIRRCISVQVLW